jgi:hypothetical protein
VEVRATNNGAEWSNMLHFMYTTEGAMGTETASVESQLMQRQLSLLQQFVQACCGAGAEASVHALMAPTLGQQQRLFGAVLALILAGSGGTNHKGGALDLERRLSWNRIEDGHTACPSPHDPARQPGSPNLAHPVGSPDSGGFLSRQARRLRLHADALRLRAPQQSGLAAALARQRGPHGGG